MAIVSRETAPVDLSSLPGRGQFPAIDTYVRPQRARVSDGGLADALKSLGANLSGFAAKETAENKAAERQNLATYVQQFKEWRRQNPNVKADAWESVNNPASPLYKANRLAVYEAAGRDSFLSFSDTLSKEYAEKMRDPVFAADAEKQKTWIAQKQAEATAAGGSTQGYSGGWNAQSRSFFNKLQADMARSRLTGIRSAWLKNIKESYNNDTGVAERRISPQANEAYHAAKAAGLSPYQLTSLFIDDNGNVDYDIKGPDGKSIFNFKPDTPTSQRVATIAAYLRDKAGGGGTAGEGSEFGQFADTPDPVKMFEAVHGKKSPAEMREFIAKRQVALLKYYGMPDSEFKMANAFKSLQKIQGLNEREHVSLVTNYIRKGGHNIDPRYTAWCAAAVEAALQEAGMKGTGKLNARSYLKWGKETQQPKLGDIAVFSRGDPKGWKGHVGFVNRILPNGDVEVLGGNQGGKGSVSLQVFPKSRVLGFRTWAGSGGRVHKDVAAQALKDAPAPAIANEQQFKKTVSEYAPRLSKDLGANKIATAAIFGNAGHESEGLTPGIEQRGVPKGKGGVGWMQWSGSRRKEFERFVKANNLKKTGNEANYKFLVKELQTPEGRAILAKMNKAKNVKEAVRIFDNEFLRSGKKKYSSRDNYASRTALALGGN